PVAGGGAGLGRSLGADLVRENAARRCRRTRRRDLRIAQMRAAEREAEPERRPFPLAALRPDRAAMQLDQLLRERQADPGPRLLARRRGPTAVEAVEGAREVVGGDPRTVVADANRRRVPVGCDGDLDMSSLRGELQRVAYEVDEHLLELLGV